MVLYDEMVNNRMESLAECLQRAFEEGYTESFKVIKNKLSTENEKYFFAPDEVTIDHAYKFESKTVAGDLSVVYLIETRDGKRGTLIDAYGPYADTKLATFIRTADELHKKSEVSGRRSWKEFLRGY